MADVTPDDRLIEEAVDILVPAEEIAFVSGFQVEFVRCPFACGFQGLCDDFFDRKMAKMEMGTECAGGGACGSCAGAGDYQRVW